MARKLPVAVFNVYQPNGDVGPCAHEDCGERAAWIVEFAVNGVDARSWVCDEHRENLVERAEVTK